MYEDLILEGEDILLKKASLITREHLVFLPIFIFNAYEQLCAQI